MQEKEQIILDPKDEEQAFQIMAQALGNLNGVQMRAVWKAFDTIEASYLNRLELKNHEEIETAEK